MSMVNADSVQLFAMLKKMQDSISSIETTKKSVKMKYEQLGAGWQDKKYNELGVVVRDCNKALNDILVIMLQAEKYVALLAKSLSEYESVQLGSTNGISASTPQTSSFAVTPSSADTTTFESNTFGSNLAFVQDRLSAERYFSRGNHYEEYRDYWENGNYTFSRNENPELVYVRARDIEGVYLSDRELGNPEGFWTRNGREGWSRENILRRASHIQDVRQNTESGMSLDELSQNPVLDDTIRSYYNNPVQVAQVGSYYVFQSDGRHRTLAAQSLDTLTFSEATDQILHTPTREENLKLLEYEEEHKKYDWARKPQIRKYDSVYNGRLSLCINGAKTFRDCRSYVLKDRLEDMMLSIYGEAEQVKQARLAREEAERQRQEQERKREEQRQQYNAEVDRTLALVNCAADYEIACRIRAYVSAMEKAHSDQDLSEWASWARSKADWYDPTVAKEDELLGRREHEKSQESKGPQHKGYRW